MQVTIKKSSRNLETLEYYGIPYQDNPSGYLVEFSRQEERRTGSKIEQIAILEKGNTFFSYMLSAGVLVVYVHESSNGLKPGDRVEHVRDGKYVSFKGAYKDIESIYAAGPCGGGVRRAGEWANVSGAGGEYTIPVSELVLWDGVLPRR